MQNEQINTQYPVGIIPVAVEYFVVGHEVFCRTDYMRYEQLKEFLCITEDVRFSCTVGRRLPGDSSCTDGAFTISCEACGTLYGSFGDIIIRHASMGKTHYAVVPTSSSPDTSHMMARLSQLRHNAPHLYTDSFSLSAKDFPAYMHTANYLGKP